MVGLGRLELCEHVHDNREIRPTSGAVDLAAGHDHRVEIGLFINKHAFDRLVAGARPKPPTRPIPIKRRTMTRHTNSKRGPHPVAAQIGSRVRLRHTLLGMNQTQLGESLGVTVQQVQKNESGVNHIWASRLWRLNQIPDVPVPHVFEGLDKGAKAWSSDDMFLKRETLELVRAYFHT